MPSHRHHRTRLRLLCAGGRARVRAKPGIMITIRARRWVAKFWIANFILLQGERRDRMEPLIMWAAKFWIVNSILLVINLHHFFRLGLLWDARFATTNYSPRRDCDVVRLLRLLRLVWGEKCAIPNFSEDALHVHHRYHHRWLPSAARSATTSYIPVRDELEVI